MSVRVHRIAGALTVGQALVEGHEERIFAFQTRAEINLVFVEREVSETASEHQQRVFEVARKLKIEVRQTTPHSSREGEP